MTSITTKELLDSRSIPLLPLICYIWNSLRKPINLNRCELPLHQVRQPGGFFCRWRDGELWTVFKHVNRHCKEKTFTLPVDRLRSLGLTLKQKVWSRLDMRQYFLRVRGLNLECISEQGYTIFLAGHLTPLPSPPPPPPPQKTQTQLPRNPDQE